MIRVLLVDDQPNLRASLHMLLDRQPGFEVVGEAQDGADAVRAAQALAPDLIVMDVQMPVMDGVEATRRIVSEAPSVKVVGYSMNNTPQQELLLLAAGAVGFVAKNAPPSALLHMLHAVVG